MTQKRETLLDEVRDGHYIRVWKEGLSHRGYTIRIWETDKPEGRSKWEWWIPGTMSVDQAVTKSLQQLPVQEE